MTEIIEKRRQVAIEYKDGKKFEVIEDVWEIGTESFITEISRTEIIYVDKIEELEARIQQLEEAKITEVES